MKTCELIRTQRRVSCTVVHTKAYVKTVREIDGSICLDTIHNVISVVRIRIVRVTTKRAGVFELGIIAAVAFHS